MSKRFFPSVFPSSGTTAYRLASIFCALAVLFCPATSANSDERNPIVSHDRMEQPIENELASRGAEFEELKSHRKRLDELQEKIREESELLRSLYISHGQLILESQPRIDTFENAIGENRIALGVLDERIDDIEDPMKSISGFNRQTTERIETVRVQMEEIRSSRFSASRKEQLASGALEMLADLEERKRLGEKLYAEYEELLSALNAGMAAVKAMGEKLKARLEILKRTSLTRRFDPLRDFSKTALTEEIKASAERIESVFDPATWEVLWARSKLGGSEKWAFFFGGLLLLFFVRRPVLSALVRIEEKCERPERCYRRLAVYLIRHSLPFLGLTIFFGIYYYFRFSGFYKSFRFSLFNIGMDRILFLIFLILTTTRWALDYLRHATAGPPTPLRSFVSLRLGRFFRFLRVFLIFGFILLWIVGTGTLISWTLKSLASAVALVWAVFFWREARRVSNQEDRAILNQKWVALLRAWTFLVFGGALALNLIGYRSLGGRWFVSWADTAILLFWGWIGLNAFREWGADVGSKAAKGPGGTETSYRHFQWAVFQFSRVVFFLIVAAAIVRIWDPAGILSARLAVLFDFTLTVGSLQFSVKGIAYAVAIVFATLVSARVGRSLTKEKILNKRTLERGLEDSILTITSYLIWTLGVLLALGTLGVDAASLAVVFGALSIGIGFGLQNIFNNFISGLILLVERPVQVGDYVEIEGVWAEVKKINVRATVVQTFDNASMIIPNSDFISRQFTNWSFKDRRIRRNMEVGVAYGSNVELVMDTLTEILREDTGTLKYPPSEVLFLDHGDSALIFRLRLWTHVEQYWASPSRIRREIDRRFRELGIEIAFPQRDLHIRSVPEGGVPFAFGSKNRDAAASEKTQEAAGA